MSMMTLQMRVFLVPPSAINAFYKVHFKAVVKGFLDRGVIHDRCPPKD